MLYISLQNFEWVLIRWLSQLIVHHLHIPHSLHSSTHKDKHEKSNKLYKLDHKTATGFCLVLASDFLELNPPKTQQKKGEKEKVKERENRFPFLIILLAFIINFYGWIFRGRGRLWKWPFIFLLFFFFASLLWLEENEYRIRTRNIRFFSKLSACLFLAVMPSFINFDLILIFCASLFL